ncbi:DNA-directed RNA polymerase III subunit RPC5 [Apophysomyces sp. BC1034]|nr:DNA-directed RNA polymerase III subunit RPC5 [Apophysomyces sp. BC1015]KAG0183518.1 DNA-directed RNA polymerase III subunit RPC5 [Apophysomyces sp. BC1021]KAG0194480.1 DNA-directed RNA polymerase III subunit RPC5 [Apophysomyces sp. BC1034]
MVEHSTETLQAMEEDPVVTRNVDTSDDEDEVLSEIPVYLSNKLSKYLYLFQYPMRSMPFNERNGPCAARVKPHAKMVELEIPLDIRSDFYNRERGEDFAMGMNDKTIKTAYDRRMEEHEEEQMMGHSYNRNKKKEEELLDKMTLTSTVVPTQTQYLVGVLHQDELHVTPIRSMVQMRTGFSYIDKIDEKWKAANKRIQDQEKLEEKTKKPEISAKATAVQISLKNSENEGSGRRNLYSMAVHNAEDEQWMPVAYYNERTPQAETVYESLYASNKEELKCTMTNADYLDAVSGIKQLH